MLVPEADMEQVADAHRRLVRAVADLGDRDVRAPSALAEWSVAHLLTHLARNADSHVRRTEASVRGEVVEQYPGGPPARRAEIDAGARRSAAELVEDVRRSAEAVETAWRGVPDAAWRARTLDTSGLGRCLFELPGRRWQEVEVHLVDLGLGVTHRDWPEDFVREWLPRVRETMAGAIPPEAEPLVFVTPAEELAWLYGRYSRADLPVLPAWG